MISIITPVRITRYWLLVLASFALTTAVVWNAFLQKQQFYPSIVYLSKSTISLAVIHLQAFVVVVLIGKILCKLFFGTLRETEIEHLVEKGWYVLTETCLAFTVFRDDFSSRFVAMFTVLLLAKCFHWLLEDRIDLMERSLNITWVFHVRVVLLIIILSIFDLTFMKMAYNITVAKGASAQLVFGFEYSILLVSTWMISMKYAVHIVDLSTQNSLENKTAYFLYMELVANGVKVVIYSAFMFIMVAIHTFPLFAIRPMYLAVKAFRKAAYDVIMSRRAIRYLNTMFTDANADELTDNLCAVCREEMTSNLKKLPCNHVFHTHCLRSWFQRQQTCPTCRIDILRHESTRHLFRGRRQGGGLPAGFAAMFNRNQPAPQAANGANNNGATNQGPSSTSGASTSGASTSVGSLNMMVPGANMFMIPPPSYTPLPNLDTLLDGMSEEELREMEGNQRRNVQARIKCLTEIQILLDAAVTQMNQYSAIMSQTDLSPLSSSTTSSKTKTKDSPKKTADATATSTSKMSKVSSEASLIDDSNIISIKREPKTEQSEASSVKTPSDKQSLISGDGPDKLNLNEIRKRRVEKLKLDGGGSLSSADSATAAGDTAVAKEKSKSSLMKEEDELD